MIEVVVVGLGVAPPSNSPLLLLKERDGDRVLPIGIGPLEAQAIAMPLQGVQPPRPMTHDVFVDVIATLGGHLRRVEVTTLKDNTFFARVILEQTGREQTIDIRPSDAIALAVRTETPIFVAEAVLDTAGLLAGKPAEDVGEPSSATEQGEVDESKLTPFKEFIDTLDLDDLGPGSGENRPS
jgi:bifunctional DNase/RNase